MSQDPWLITLLAGIALAFPMLCLNASVRHLDRQECQSRVIESAGATTARARDYCADLDTRTEILTVEYDTRRMREIADAYDGWVYQ